MAAVMPPEWAAHERTLMGWPCRRELWGGELEAAKEQYAGVANAIAAFEPVTMVVPDAAGAAEARPVLTEAVSLVELAIDDSWLRDSGPIFTLEEETGARAAVQFGFNGWGEKFRPFDQDATIATRLCEQLGEPVERSGLILEGGSIGVDGTGFLVTTEQCLLHPSRNPDRSRLEIEEELRARLGVREIVWLGLGLLEDRDTDGHVDLIAAFTGPGELLLQAVGPEDPNHDAMEENRLRAEAAGLTVTSFPLLPRLEVAGEQIVASYLNFYVGSDFVIVPTAGVAEDADALARIAAAYPAQEVVGVPGEVIAYGGGGPHCITQQVPAVRD
ncbi:MAG: agmatine deiminase family protein [Solirubrobacterales bacterium]|nr:agmatine deiminase family protein [Solirubrobacterales bacterium]